MTNQPEAPTSTTPEPNLQDAITELEQRVESLLSGSSALEHRLIDPSTVPDDPEKATKAVTLKDRITDITRKINQVGTHTVNIENYLGV